MRKKCFYLSVAIAAAILAGCAGDDGPSSAAASGKDSNLPFAGQKLFVFNWSDYIDSKLIEKFERRTGASVQYDNYSTDSELEAKLIAGGGGYDVAFPTDRTMPALIEKGLLLKLDKELLPNLKNIDPEFLAPPFDPDNDWSAPYFWGTVAIGYRADRVQEPVRGLEVLFDERYAGRITVLDDPENVVGAVLKHLGYSVNSTDPKHLDEAKELLRRQRPLLQAYTSDAFKEKLIAGDAWVVLGWSGDILQAAGENENIRAVVPERGTIVWMDSMTIPKGARNVPLAHAFINFLMEPDIAARNANYVRYASPNAAAKEMLDADLLADPAIYPPPEILDRCEWLHDRGPAIVGIERLWREIRQ